MEADEMGGLATPANQVNVGESKGSLPAASLIICTRNRPGLLADTVASVLSGDEVPAELVIVDQSGMRHPELKSAQDERGCTIKYLWTCSVGTSRARNEGIKAAGHEIVAIIDDDMLADSGWYGALIRALIAAGPEVVVTGQVLPGVEKAPDGFAVTILMDPTPVEHAGRANAAILAGGHMAAYRATLLEVGGFDERLGPGTKFPSAEDTDLCFRLLEAGYRIVTAPEAILYHREWRPQREFAALRWKYGLGRGAFYAKHLDLRDRYILKRMAHDVRTHGLTSLGSLRSNRRRAMGDAALALGILYGATRWMLTQRRKR